MSILDERIEKANTICIIGHQHPDGDCIGATLSIYNYIQNKYGDKKIVKPFLNEISSKFMVLKNADKIKDDKNDATVFDLCIAVDVSSLDRIKEFERYFKDAKDTLVIDHHESNTLPAKVSIVFPESIATCEVLYGFLDKSFIDKDIAMCLYIGIATDSGVFRYRETRKRTFEVVGELISYGFNFTKLLDEIVFNNTMNQRKAQGIAFERLVKICKGEVSFTYLNSDELESLGLEKNDIDNIVVYIREIDDIKLAAFAYQVGDKIYKLSLRSNRDNINVAKFAAMHDGGGHAFAAGCMYYGDIDKVKEKLEKDLGEFIEKSESDK